MEVMHCCTSAWQRSYQYQGVMRHSRDLNSLFSPLLIELTLPVNQCTGMPNVYVLTVARDLYWKTALSAPC